MVSTQQRQQSTGGDRYTPMLKLAKELGQKKLLENKRARQRQWTAEKRKRQSQIINDNKPWLKSTGPRTLKGKVRASKNALRHGLRSADYVEIRKMLKAQRLFVREMHKDTFKNIQELELFHATQSDMTSITEKAKQIKQFLGAEGFSASTRDIRNMMQAVTGHDEADMIAKPDTPVTPEQEERLDEIAKRYKAGEPLTRVLGTREFWGLDFKVTPDTLDPRPDTETLIEAALAWVDKAGLRDKPIRILDLGTGTGCIPIALLSELPNATAVAVDISPAAIEVARENVQKHKMSDRLTVQQGSWMEGLEGQHFDLIVSNPPYIAESVIADLDVGVKNHDPHLALSGGNDGLDCYKIIISSLKTHLNQEARAFLEIGFDQLESLTGLVGDSGLCLCDSHADIAGIPRVVEISSGDK